MVGGCQFQAFWVGSKHVRSKFFIFLELGKKSEIFFSKKNRDFSVKIGILSGNIGIYRKISVFIGKIGDFSPIFLFPIFHLNIFSSTIEIRYFSEKSVEIGDFFVHVDNCRARVSPEGEDNGWNFSFIG